MPPQDPNPVEDTSTPNSSAMPDDKVLREDWKKLSKDDQDSYFKSLPAADQANFATRVGLFDSKAPISVSATPKTGSIPWMKEKAYSILNWEANQFPSAGGIVGGIIGGLGGEAIDPAGGGAPGAFVGSYLGGGVGEAGRQSIEHQEGRDKYDDPETKTWGYRFRGMDKAGQDQAIAELTGQKLGKLMRPTLERSLAKLYYAGGIKYGNPLGKGDLETVINDLIKTEKDTGKATTVGDFLGVIKQAKNDIGQEVDLKMALPIKQNGVMTTLGKAEADSTPIVNAINSLATADPSIVKEATLNKAGKEAAYLATIKNEALKFSQHPWTYEELTSKRIRLNNELAPLYLMPPGEARVYLLSNPDLAIKKAQADAIRDIIYPKMDVLSGQPMGTTAELQGKRGALMSIENQVNDHLSTLKTKARQAQGAPLTEKANISTYGTSSMKPGFSVHRLTSIVHSPNPERSADKQVSKAFGHRAGPRIRKAVTSPYGQVHSVTQPATLNDLMGNEILSLPIRVLSDPPWKTLKDNSKPPADQDENGPQSSVSTPKELLQRAKDLNPSAQGQTAYTHTAINPVTQHRIGSPDGKNWYDIQSGKKVA